LNDCEKLKLLTNIAINFFLDSKIIFQAQGKLFINNVEIIACKLELLFKNPINDFINQEINAERERSIT
jgi:hypothetical protein